MREAEGKAERLAFMRGRFGVCSAAPALFLSGSFSWHEMLVTHIFVGRGEDPVSCPGWQDGLCGDEEDIGSPIATGNCCALSARLLLVTGFFF